MYVIIIENGTSRAGQSQERAEPSQVFTTGINYSMHVNIHSVCLCTPVFNYCSRL